MTPLIALTLLQLAVQLGDWYTTRGNLKSGGSENFKFSAWAMTKMPMDVYLGLKVLVITGASYWIGTQVLWLLAFALGFYFAIVINNYQSMIKKVR